MKTHWHNTPFICAKGGSDGSFVNVIGVDACLKKAVSHVNYRPNFALSAVDENVRDLRKRVVVRNGVCI